MKPEEQRIAIAEWCGWKADKTCSNPWHWTWGISLNEKSFRIGVKTNELPRYTEDLNAIREAVVRLRFPETQSLWRQNEMELNKILVRDNRINNDSVSFQWESQNATAAQRAEALLRTIGKWDDHCTVKGEVAS